MRFLALTALVLTDFVLTPRGDLLGFALLMRLLCIIYASFMWRVKVQWIDKFQYTALSDICSASQPPLTLALLTTLTAQLNLLRDYLLCDYLVDDFTQNLKQVHHVTSFTESAGAES